MFRAPLLSELHRLSLARRGAGAAVDPDPHPCRHFTGRPLTSSVPLAGGDGHHRAPQAIAGYRGSSPATVSHCCLMAGVRTATVPPNDVIVFKQPAPLRHENMRTSVYIMVLNVLIRKGMASYLLCTGSRRPKSATSVGKDEAKTLPL